MKKIAIYFSALGLVWLFVGANVSSVIAATDAASTAELQIIDDGPVNPTTPPSEIPSGETVENPEPIVNHPNGPIDSLQNQQVAGSMLGSLKQSVQKMFPKTAEATNWWLVVIGVEVLLLVSLLYFNKKEKSVWGGKVDA